MKGIAITALLVTACNGDRLAKLEQRVAQIDTESQASVHTDAVIRQTMADRFDDVERDRDRWWYCPATDDGRIDGNNACRRTREDCVRANVRCVPVTSAWCNDGRNEPECFFSVDTCRAAGLDTKSPCTMRAP